jgi:hypothetical protein
MRLLGQSKKPSPTGGVFHTGEYFILGSISYWGVFHWGSPIGKRGDGDREVSAGAPVFSLSLTPVL